MISHIRRLVYRLGFDPKHGTILYSPSLALIKTMDQALRDVKLLELPPINPRIFMDSLTKETMTMCAKYCVFCGVELNQVGPYVKECEHGHGRAYPTEDRNGLPVITFELND